MRGLVRGSHLMLRWQEQSPRLPLQPIARLVEQYPWVAESLADPGRASRQAPVVLLSALARAEAFAHLATSTNELGGLLLGEVYTADGNVDANATRAVLLTRAVAADDFASSGISLRMESGVWERARAQLGALELVVGWYHSHPGLGAFFSGTDRRTQRAFFPHAYSVGWVIDPFRREEAVFLGADSVAAVAFALADVDETQPPAGGPGAGTCSGAGVEPGGCGNGSDSSKLST